MEVVRHGFGDSYVGVPHLSIKWLTIDHRVGVLRSSRENDEKVIEIVQEVGCQGFMGCNL